jgi:hypothetical protein
MNEIMASPDLSSSLGNFAATATSWASQGTFNCPASVLQYRKTPPFLLFYEILQVRLVYAKFSSHAGA